MKEYNIIDAFFEDNQYKDEQQFINKNLDITEQIYAYLAEKGWSQSDLAEKLGKKNSEISKWLSGTHNLTLKSITKLETMLGKDIITTPQKISAKHQTIKYVNISVKTKLNNKINDGIPFTENQKTEFKETFMKIYQMQ